MTIDEQVEKRVYNRLRAYDGVEVAGHAPVNSSIASVLSEGEVLADNGEQYSSIQQAVDVSDGFVFVGPGTFNENVTINTDRLTLQGSGRGTIIDGGSNSSIVINTSDNVTLNGIAAQNDVSGSSDVITFNGDSSRFSMHSCHILEGGGRGVSTRATGGQNRDLQIEGCTFKNLDAHGIVLTSERAIISNCTFKNMGRGVYLYRDGGVDSAEVIITNCVFKDNNYGIRAIDATDSIFIGNRIHNSDVKGIQVRTCQDIIVANNRVSDSVDANISVEFGSGTVTDGNLTGSAN
jgi:parallel beta-helix repeat protein